MATQAKTQPHTPGRLSEVDEELDYTLKELMLAYGASEVQIRLSELTNQAHNGSAAALRVLQVILRQIVFSKDPQLEAEVMALGTGVLLHDEQSMRSVGAKHGISWQAVSKRVVAFVEERGLPPSAFMRSEKDRVTYSLTNKPRVA